MSFKQNDTSKSYSVFSYMLIILILTFALMLTMMILTILEYYSKTAFGFYLGTTLICACFLIIGGIRFGIKYFDKKNENFPTSNRPETGNINDQEPRFPETGNTNDQELRFPETGNNSLPQEYSNRNAENSGFSEPETDQIPENPNWQISTQPEVNIQPSAPVWEEPEVSTNLSIPGQIRHPGQNNPVFEPEDEVKGDFELPSYDEALKDENAEQKE